MAAPVRNPALVAAFADRLAEGRTIYEACADLGVHRNTGSNIMRQIKRDLGWQAQ